MGPRHTPKHQHPQPPGCVLDQARQPAGPGEGFPLGVCALVQAPPLAASLRHLLQNGSLLDIGLRRPLYLELSQLLRTLGARGPSTHAPFAWEAWLASMGARSRHAGLAVVL